MECNCLPKSESTCLCLPIQERSVHGANCSHEKYLPTTIKVLGAAVVFLSVVVAYLIIQTNQLEKTLQRLQNNEEAQVYLAQRPLFEPKSILYGQKKSSEINRNLEYRREKRNGRWRNQVRAELSEIKRELNKLVNTTIRNLEDGIMKKVVHLTMSSSMTQDTLKSPVNNIEGCYNRKHCFRWSDPESIYSSTFDYIRDNAYNMPVAIKVRSPGIYLVYAQVAVNGPERGYEPSVGFETVLVHGGNEKTLIKSYITQDNRGQAYYDITVGEYPFDTVNHMGMFKLECDDYIMIRPIGDPTFIYTNTEASYFGVVQINPARALLHGDYSCNTQE
ncbi:uncharacterized protein LOC133202463 [Saccostrea echinata]|uniref:uncharacterized protein LOC133202463 n=1 Tax=Saccostrea echinata TaxID=191078 RepID=UPI002A83BB1F|nr:uncharacterized protein LOC133202463 [Saccostrea echinata]